MTESSVFYRQSIQVVLGLLSVLGLWVVTDYLIPIPSGSYWGIDHSFWFWLAILIPIIHQLVVAVLWRYELYQKGLTNLFGSTHHAFTIFKIIFALFFGPRMLLTLPLALGTANTFDNSILRLIFLIFGILLTPLIFYGIYSVRRYFGIGRAFGADHFFEKYRDIPLVQEGLFKYSNNVMYVFVVAFATLPGLYLGSPIAILAGVFNQVFIWVHYFATEKPDMQYLYAK